MYRSSIHCLFYCCHFKTKNCIKCSRLPIFYHVKTRAYLISTKYYTGWARSPHRSNPCEICVVHFFVTHA
uniref:Uncharacterized protein n=1 Tax=Timema cristinae TaxID=61476 RepID=A0A7R9DPW1_TIMCR|nr:unnamed protein product [Timema cristinae]